MAYVNMSSALKNARASTLNSQLGGAATANVYSGAIPLSPDQTPAGTLLGSIALASTPGIVTYGVEAATVANGGTGGTTGTQTVTGTTGTGTKFTASVTIAGGTITAVNSITTPGSYTVLPSSLAAEPVTGGGLTGSPTLTLEMTAQWTMAGVPLTQPSAAATGTATFVRLATSGGTGVIDGDCATSGATFTINTTSIVALGPIALTATLFSEP